MADQQNHSLEQALNTSIQLDITRNQLLAAQNLQKKGVDQETIAKLNKLAENTAATVQVTKEQNRESVYQSKTLAEVRSSSKTTSEQQKTQTGLLSKVGSAIGFLASGMFKILTFPARMTLKLLSHIASGIWNITKKIAKTIWEATKFAFKAITAPLRWIANGVWAVSKTIFNIAWATTKFIAKSVWFAMKTGLKLLLAPLYVGFKFFKWFANTWVGKLTILVLAIWAIKTYFGDWIGKKWDSLKTNFKLYLDAAMKDPNSLIGKIASTIDLVASTLTKLYNYITHSSDVAVTEASRFVGLDVVSSDHKQNMMRKWRS